MSVEGRAMSIIRPRSNLRTALVLLSVAAVFFAGVIVNRVLFGP